MVLSLVFERSQSSPRRSRTAWLTEMFNRGGTDKYEQARPRSLRWVGQAPGVSGVYDGTAEAMSCAMAAQAAMPAMRVVGRSDWSISHSTIAMINLPHLVNSPSYWCCGNENQQAPPLRPAAFLRRPFVSARSVNQFIAESRGRIECQRGLHVQLT
jgi:hypothetical protein